MDFTENVTLSIPQIDRSMVFTESEGDSHGLIVEVAAIHEGLTSNFNHYSKDALEAALESWVSPYPKPIIMNHDPLTEAVGRVMAAKMDQEADGTPFTRLQVAITDPAAIEKILDQRYLTGSVGGKASEAACSVCEADWSKASAMSLPCKHKRGTTYKGKLAYIEMKNIGFKEYSFVNMPADGRSGIRSTGTGVSADEAGSNGDGWVRSARIFDLNMNKEEVLEYTESESRNVLSGMRKKDAAPLYLSLKGAFLSALAANENDKSDEVVEAEEDDLLAVSEELSADLAKPVVEEAEEEVSAEEEDAAKDGEENVTHLHVKHKDKEHVTVFVGGAGFNEEPDGDADDAPIAPSTTATASDDEDVTGESNIDSDANNKDNVANVDPRAKRAEGQAKTRAVDVDPETGKGAPRSREADEEEVVTESDTELNEAITVLESNLAEAEARYNSLLEENAKLKAALKRNLAERVVDTKINLGLSERATREMDLQEHVGRSASSLADSLRDLSHMTPRRADYSEFPTVENVVSVNDVAESGHVVNESEEENVKPVAPIRVAESLFTDALMGRRKL